jgi:hypothetical protein
MSDLEIKNAPLDNPEQAENKEDEKKDPSLLQFDPSRLSDKWNESDEELLKEWSDKARCYKWLYEQSYKLYYFIYLLFTLPVIIITTISGTANFAQTLIPVEGRTYFALGAGSLSLIAGMITTIAQFLKISELKETYNMCYKSWDKFTRTLGMELQLHPDERGPKGVIIDSSKKEYDRLVELSPTIPGLVALSFKSTFRKSYTISNNPNEVLIKPDIVDTIKPTKIFDRSKLPRHEERKPLISVPVTPVYKPTVVDIFIDKFKNKYGREPTSEEIKDELNIV